MMVRLLLPIILALSACTSRPVVQTPLPEPAEVVLNYSSKILADPFNVSIVLFNGKTSEVSRIYAPIREAESAYLPVQLRNTLDESGYWGAVNVVPSKDVAAELLVTGKIVESDAVTLALDIEVRDSRGHVWFSKVYRDYAMDYAMDYATDYGLEVLENTTTDPFQDLFNQIANDMSEAQSLLQANDRLRILDTSMLRYAMLLSPEAFSRYLIVDEFGEIAMQGLPARNDPLYSRVRQIREREFSMQDVVDEHFENFYDDMQKIYPFWRQSSYELLVYNNQLEGRQRKGPRAGSWAAVESVYRTYKELKLNEDELRELASSFEREISPTVTEMEGRVIELQGSLSSQYKTWRRLLREIYAETTGTMPGL